MGGNKRLTRRVRRYDTPLSMHFADGWGCLVSCEAALDTRTAPGRPGLNVRTFVGQCEREAIGERTRSALASNAAPGEPLGGVPFGSRLAAGGLALEPHPPEREIIDRMRELTGGGLSLPATGRRLDAEGVPARSAKWHPTTVARLLWRAEAA